MKMFHLPFEENLKFSRKDLAYIQADKNLKPFYKYDAELNNFPKVIEDKKSSYRNENRALLQKVLEEQYSNMPEDPLAGKQIDLLAENNTFTICTAHQPCLMTGPLYVILKIASTIHLCRNLKKEYPEFNFIPVFISGGEDHDLEETNHFYLYGKKLEWKTKQSGAVGRMDLSGIDEMIQTVEEFSGNSPFAEDGVKLLRDARSGATNYGEFFRRIIGLLFRGSGLIVLNMDEADLKREGIDIFKSDLLESPSRSIINKTQKELEAIGFDQQAYVRRINLFYLHKGQRQRIERVEGGFRLVDNQEIISTEEMLTTLNNHPERFSPNVVLRPLYQELILPNLAYIGGGGEISYWLERKKQFEHYGVNYPMLMRRNSIFWIDHIGDKNLKQLELNPTEIFKGKDSLIKEYILEEAEEEISLVEEKSQLKQLFLSIEQKAKKLDQSILKTIRAEEVKHLKSVDHLENKLLKAKKHQMESRVNKIKKVHDKLFPFDKPQERVDNFLMYYFRMGPDWLNLLLENLDPLDRRVCIFQEGD